MPEILETELKGVLEIHPEIFEDHRGEIQELWRQDKYMTKGFCSDFVQDNISISSKNVLRGIHGDSNTWKLISCLYGKIYFVVVNCDLESSEFGRWKSFTLSDKKRTQILLPPKFGNAHLVLSNQAIFHYKLSAYYNSRSQFSYKWDDSRFKIWWPIKNPILSRRDESGHYVD